VGSAPGTWRCSVRFSRSRALVPTAGALPFRLPCLVVLLSTSLLICVCFCTSPRGIESLRPWVLHWCVPSASEADASLRPEPGASALRSAGAASAEVCVCALAADSGVSAPEDREAAGAAERGRAAGDGRHGAGQGAHGSGTAPQRPAVPCPMPLEIGRPCLLLTAAGSRATSARCGACFSA